ncbi:MBL fold metallo-hydrolase [Lactiplantibacillus mudanjiangensis]|uniref:MBL fold metallo-hydrolase [Lactobacillus curvatus] n=1 Tax=Lactiplantibacillus mudanjiangensis TaxID=1296538 RepID=A0A660E3P8_9LACO|nr:MBL fold metallo-hydrolase [Lactiplantibacillus mudanjiangensis]VDG20249.1 MBL fold metallo-hydrolase [Lactobacillus curvatus] [Lactiplantibacillus mudanjiangensis]VDG24060.1 MBL fold metallo-hydrolase [Lactobacillus curvatus] [Lactiplantibacillus mudanjiangensis]VDG30240.1 MBL fold metallo-hydrolase [Lactobacillus curvatus] [Lactiplantibacillus mudanjiangensis]VDG33842.1 MBL fold metallo-hydrolase [Lactobacillus curvatus] [Lactiplantibacillus mudanjiangensis]
MIDFSSKHHILIQNSETAILRPMDYPFFESKLIATGVWQILSDGDLSYLVEGNQEAIVIDSGYGAGDLRSFCEQLTLRPVRRILNTHDHFDHTANNSYFDVALMSAKTAPLATLPFPSFAGIDFPRDYPKQIIAAGDVIELGQRQLNVYALPDHAVGSLAFLDQQSRILFCGDEITPLGKIINGSVSVVRQQFKRLMAVRDQFDWLCSGPQAMLPATMLDVIYQDLIDIVDHDAGTSFTEFPLTFPPHQIRTDVAQTVYLRQEARPEDRQLSMKSEDDTDQRVIVHDGFMTMYHADQR